MADDHTEDQFDPEGPGIEDIDLQDEEGTDVVPCPACGVDVYQSADRCPACGQFVVPGAGATSPGICWWWIVVALIMAAGLLWLVAGL